LHRLSFERGERLLAETMKEQHYSAFDKPKWAAVLFLLPGIITFLLFRYYPMVKAIIMSFYDYSIMNPPGKFVGFGNYTHAFQDPMVGLVWKNTATIVGLSLLGFFIPIILAIFLDEVRSGKVVFRTIYIIPAIMPSMVTIVLWKWFYNPDYGLLNIIRQGLGAQPLGWLNDPKLAKLCLAIPGFLTPGYTALIYLAALQGISKQMYEAAIIDGASFWQKLWYITLPRIVPMMGIMLIMGLISAFQMFEGPFVFTGGGPLNSTKVVALYIYEEAFSFYRMGYGTTMAVILFIFLMALTWLQVRCFKTDPDA
jgi:multiple sugar transport system permease protein